MAAFISLLATILGVAALRSRSSPFVFSFTCFDLERKKVKCATSLDIHPHSTFGVSASLAPSSVFANISEQRQPLE